jgi:hypothetical protein
VIVNEPITKKQRVTKQAVFTYLDKKSEDDASKHRDEFKLRQDELQLQRDRFEAEKEEKERRWLAESDERQRRQQMDLRMMELMTSIIQKKTPE